jgi:putative transposase
VTQSRADRQETSGCRRDAQFGQGLGSGLKTLEVSEATLHRWRAQFGGMKGEEAKRLKEPETANSRLKRLLAVAELDKAMLK